MLLFPTYTHDLRSVCALWESWEGQSYSKDIMHMETLGLFPTVHPSVSVFCRGTMLVTRPPGATPQAKRKSVSFGSQGQE